MQNFEDFPSIQAPAEAEVTAEKAADDEIDLFGSSDEEPAAKPAPAPAKVQPKKVEKSKMQQKAEAHAAKQAAAAKKAAEKQPSPAKEVRVDVGDFQSAIG